MAKTYDLLVRARGETRDAERAMKQLQRNVDRFGKRTRNIGLGLTAAVTLPLVGLGKMGASELGEIEKANAQTERALARVGKESLISAANITKSAEALQAKSGIDDQAIQSAENLIVTLSGLDLTTKLGADSFDKTRTSMVEFADTLGVDVTSAAKLYAKSIAAAGQGTIVLPRGVKLSAEEMQKLEKRMDAASSSGERQAAVIDALAGKFKGGMDLTNSEKWNVSMDKLAGSAAKLVVLLLPAFDRLIGVVANVTGWFDRLSPSAQKLVGTGLLIAGALGPVLVIVGSLVSALSALVPVLVGLSLPVAGAIAAVAALGVAFVAAYTKSAKFRAQVNSAFREVAATVRVLVAQMSVTIREFVATAKIVWARWGDDILGVVGPALKVIVTLVKFNMGMILDQIRFGLALLRGDWGDAWDLLKGMVRRALGAAADVARNSGKAVVRAVRGLGDGIAALKDYFVQKGEAIGRAIASGIASAVKGAASSVADAAKDVADSALDKVLPGRSRRGKGVAASGVTALGQLFGPRVNAGQVMRYVGLEGAQPYSVSQNADGTETLNTNKAIVAFLEERKKINELQLRKRIAQRNAMVAKVDAAKKAYLAAKRSKVPSSAAGKKARLKRIQSAFRTLVTRSEAVAELNAEILTLGGAIEDDAESLTPPEIDTVADAVAGDSDDAGASTTTNTTTASTTGVSGTGVSASPLTQGSNYNPLAPTSQSALGAVASSVLRSMGGTTVNLIANSGDPEAIAHRVAFFLGSSRLRAGGGF